MENEKTEVKDQVAELVEEVRANPSNAELLDNFKEHAEEDHQVAKAQAEVNAEVSKSLASLHAWKETVATKDDVRAIFAQELRNFFKITGLNTKAVIVTTATIIGALVVIFGGAKSFLAWIGFGYLK